MDQSSKKVLAGVQQCPWLWFICISPTRTAQGCLERCMWAMFPKKPFHNNCLGGCMCCGWCECSRQSCWWCFCPCLSDAFGAVMPTPRWSNDSSWPLFPNTGPSQQVQGSVAIQLLQWLPAHKPWRRALTSALPAPSQWHHCNARSHANNPGDSQIM